MTVHVMDADGFCLCDKPPERPHPADPNRVMQGPYYRVAEINGTLHCGNCGEPVEPGG